MQITDQLIDDCCSGDRKAQEKLYKICFSPLINICHRFSNSKDDAAILLNESFYKIITQLASHDRNVSFLAWAKRITLNHCIDQYRKKNRHQTRVMEDVDLEVTEGVEDEPFEVPEKDSPSHAEFLREVKEEILSLPQPTQEVFQLFVLEGFSHKDIARLLNMKEGTSKWHVSNARKMLRRVFRTTLNKMSTLEL